MDRLSVDTPTPIRNGYGAGLLAVADTHPEVVVLDADLGASTRGAWFADRYPDRHFDVGIAEQDLVMTAAGLASVGRVPFAGTFAAFSLRALEQIRNGVARPGLNVTIVGSHGGVATGPDGASAQAVEDLAVYRSLPNTVVVSPGDAMEAARFVERLAVHDGPAYLRLVREPTPVLFGPDRRPELGGSVRLRNGEDVTLAAHGAATHVARDAADRLAETGVDARVLHCPSIKPVDETALRRAANETRAVVTVEDHSVVGGLGGAVAETLADTRTPVHRLGIDDTFGESGDADALYETHGLTPAAVAADVREVLD